MELNEELPISNLIKLLCVGLLVFIFTGSQHINNSEPEKIKPIEKTTALVSPKVETPLAPVPTPIPAPAQAPVAVAPVTVSYTHEDLMVAAGISPTDFGAVDYIISHESGWNENATNSSSGAHGLPQALPYSKTGCGWSDALCQLTWANTYANSRYGGWWPAQAYWASNGNW